MHGGEVTSQQSRDAERPFWVDASAEEKALEPAVAESMRGQLNRGQVQGKIFKVRAIYRPTPTANLPTSIARTIPCRLQTHVKRDFY